MAHDKTVEPIGYELGHVCKIAAETKPETISKKRQRGLHLWQNQTTSEVPKLEQYNDAGCGDESRNYTESASPKGGRS